MGIWRLMRIALLTAVVASIGAAIAVYVLASRSLPSYSGERMAAGLGDEVEILRDRRAVPHIFAQSERDAYFALGYAHAQDRLWQMEVRRRLVDGRLTELAGAWGRRSGRKNELLRLDVAARTLDLTGRARKSLRAMSRRTLSILEAYAAGVNAWLAEVDGGSLGRGAPELLFLGAQVAPWRPEDSVAAFKLMAAMRSAGVFGELTRARFLTGLGPERAADLFPAPGGPATMALPPYGAPLPNAPAPLSAGGLGDAVPAADVFGGGSNAWAASGARSATRAPLFASDPHAPLSAPGLWYLARLSHPKTQTARGGEERGAQTRELIGATIPGIPAVLFGRSRALAWSATDLAADVGDIFIEQLDPEDPSRYRTPQGWAAFETRDVRIPLGDGEAAAATLKSTRHGPVLPLDWPAVAAATPKGHVAALSWTVLAEDDRSLEAALEVSRAATVGAALAAAEGHTAPPQTLFVVDRRSIAMAAVGRIPLRRPDSLSRGAWPSNGWSAENDWAGRLAPEDMPKSVDPPSGLLAHADNRLTEGDFPKHLGHDWAAPYRLTRINKLLNSRPFHTRDGFQSFQSDTVSEMARSVLPLMAETLWAERERETGLRRQALDRLAAWNGDMDAFLAEPLIFAAWSRALIRRLTADELAPLGLLYDGARPLFLERVFLDRAGAGARWCDDIRTETVEGCPLMASLALDDALAALKARYGGAIDGWRWGRAHEAVHRHWAFGDAPLVGAVLNIRQETGGGDHTLQRGLTTGRGAKPFANRAAGGFRAIYDFADLDRSVVAIANGQSGHFLSRHYDDFAEIWRSGEYAPLSLARQDAEAGSVGVLRLAPPEF